MEVFKQTSIFNVKSALAHNHALMSAREIDETNDRWHAHCRKMLRMYRSFCALGRTMQLDCRRFYRLHAASRITPRESHSAVWCGATSE